MARLTLSKQALIQEQERLRLYQRLLPSLDLKRRQLSAAVKRAEAELSRLESERRALQERIGEELPMLAHPDFNLGGLVVSEGVDTGEEIIVGVRLPVFRRLRCRVADYSRLATPPWVDVLVARWRQALALEARIDVAARRVAILRRQVRKVTQRVNLFEKVLIPTARNNIKRIRLHLDEVDRTAVVISKLAKRKQQAARGEMT